MAGLHWFVENWFDLFSALGIIASLLFAAVSLRSETKTRRIANLLQITEAHRQIWTQVIDRPELGRILDIDPNLKKKPVTRAEEILVTMVIHQMANVFEAIKNELFIKQEGLRRDIAWFLDHPIPKLIWEKLKVLQNDDFAEFVERCRNWK